MTLQRAMRLMRTTYYSSVLLMFALIMLTVAILNGSFWWTVVSYLLVASFVSVGAIALGIYDSSDQSDKEKVHV